MLYIKESLWCKFALANVESKFILKLLYFTPEETLQENREREMQFDLKRLTRKMR